MTAADKPTVPDEAVEAAARAITVLPWHVLSDKAKDNAREAARTALAAAQPLLTADAIAAERGLGSDAAAVRARTRQHLIDAAVAAERERIATAIHDIELDGTDDAFEVRQAAEDIARAGGHDYES